MRNTNDIALTILAPMYNEAENVEKTLMALNKTMLGFAESWEILFVNDGSRDGTLEIARGFEKTITNLRVISYPENCGRGKALRTGFENARGKYVISIDFDLSYSPDHILRIYQELVDPEQMADVVLGSAYMVGGKTSGVSPLRLLVSKGGNLILRFAFPRKFNTTTCILRGYRKEVLDSLDLSSDGKEIHLEILSKVCALGFNIKEIPATLTSRKEGPSKFRFRQTAFTHVIFSLFERPLVLFGALGMLLILAGLGLGAYIVWLRYSGNLTPTRPLISLIILLFIVGSQFFCFAFIATQNNVLRNELYRLLKRVRLMEKSASEKRNKNIS